jgi:hypothetical protein
VLTDARSWRAITCWRAARRLCQAGVSGRVRIHPERCGKHYRLWVGGTHRILDSHGHQSENVERKFRRRRSVFRSTERLPDSGSWYSAKGNVMAVQYVPPVPTPAVPYGQPSVESAGQLVAAFQLDGRSGPGLTRAAYALLQTMRQVAGEDVRAWRALSMTSGVWREAQIDNEGDIEHVLRDADVAGALANFRTGAFTLRAIRTVDVVEGWRLSGEVVMPPADALHAGERFEASASTLVRSGKVECGYVNVGGWSNPLVEVDEMRLVPPATWDEAARWAPGYVWVVFLAHEAASRCGLTPGPVASNVTVTQLPSGSWRVAAVPPDHPDHDAALLAMRKLLWPSLPLVVPYLGSQTPPRIWEGGPIGIAARYLDAPGLDQITTVVRLCDGESMRVRIRVAGDPDDGTITDVAWTIDAWRRFGYAYRDGSHQCVAFSDWLVPEITAGRGHIDVVVPRTDATWAAMLRGVLNERRCIEPRHGTTRITDVEVPPGC